MNRSASALVWLVHIFIASAAAIDASAAAELRVGDARLSAAEGRIELKSGGRSLLELTSVRFDYHDPIGWKILESDRDRIVIELLYPAAVDFAHRPPADQPRAAQLTITARTDGFRFQATPEWADQTTLLLEYQGDHFFGLSEPLQPDNQLSPDLTGASISVEVASEGGQLMENFATAYSAFYLSSFGYGSFFDTFARGRYDFAINGQNRIHHDTGALDWYLFLGDNGPDIHAAYYRVIGEPKKIPLWGLGPIGWRDQNDGGAKEILGDIERLTEMRIPFTSWFVDRPYSDGNHAWSEMNFSAAFAEPGVWIQRIREEFGLEFMTWTATATFGDYRFPKHLAGSFSYLDLSHPPTAQAFQQELQRQQHAFGVKGHKADRADEVFPTHESWHDSAVDLAQRRNRYVHLFLKAHDDALRASWGDDQMTFARAAYHRSQPHLSTVWGGDPRTSWEGMRSNFANGIRCSFMGFPVWGSDVGGYQGEGYIPEDLYIRWMQAGSMSGLFEIKLDGAGGEGRDRMPWRYGKRFQEVFRDICSESMRFLPYLHTLARNAAVDGPLMQPLAYRHLGDRETYGIWDQFYLGDAIMVAPVFEPGQSRSVYLPDGEWRSYRDRTQRFEGGKRYDIDAPLDTLPRFVRANSLYVTGDIHAGNAKAWAPLNERLTIHALPGNAGDSATLNYIDAIDGDRAKPITLRRIRDSITLQAPALKCPSTIEIVLDARPQRVEQNGKEIPFTFSEDSALLAIEVGANQALDLAVTTD